MFWRRRLFGHWWYGLVAVVVVGYSLAALATVGILRSDKLVVGCSCRCDDRIGCY